MSTMERNTPQFQSENVHEKIARRAYEVYERRGGQDGYDLDDWLKAESEVRSEMARPDEKSAGAQRRTPEEPLSANLPRRSSQKRAG